MKNLLFLSAFTRLQHLIKRKIIMETDELSYNVFYLLLRNEFRKKYELATAKCWTICVPCGDSLREVPITKEFVDDHVLRPLVIANSSPSSLRFSSTDDNESHHTYEIVNNEIVSIDDEDDCLYAGDSRVKVLSMEKGYNKEFQPYNIILVDKPIRGKYRMGAKLSQTDKLKLDRSVTCYREAVEFLKELPEDKFCPLDDLFIELESIKMNQDFSMENLKEVLKKLIRDCWADTMRKQSLAVQRDARFQKLLSVSLEIFAMHELHDTLYAHIGNTLEREDLAVREKIDELIEIGVTPDQLGVKESLAVAMPSAMVELATLDSHKGPLEKLMCLKGTLDFIVAEIKGAIAEVEFKSDFINEDDDSSNRTTKNRLLPDTDDLIPLLLYVIVKCRCQRLYTDLHYIENFVWSISPHDGLSYTLVTFKAALFLLEQIEVSELPEKTRRIKKELEIKDLIEVVGVKDAKTSLDNQMRSLVQMLEECTKT